MTARDRSGERDEIDARIANRPLGVFVAQVQRLEYAVRQARFLERGGELLGAQRRLRRMLQDDDVACHERWHDAVHRDEIGVVPRRDRQHDAERLAADEAFEVLFRTSVDVSKHLRRDRDHVARALERAADLVRRVAARAAHLPRQLARDLLALRFEQIAEAVEDARTLGNGNRAPGALRDSRPIERAFDLRRLRQRALDVDAVVDWGDDFEHGRWSRAEARPTSEWAVGRALARHL